jgi:hypothetical protein
VLRGAAIVAGIRLGRGNVLSPVFDNASTSSNGLSGKGPQARNRGRTDLEKGGSCAFQFGPLGIIANQAERLRSA